MTLVAIISNPLSTTNQKVMPRIRRFVAENADLFHIEIRGIDDLPQALAMAARAEPRVLVINGGDGTIQAVLSALIRLRPFGDNPPPIAVLAGGKTNMIAADLGMKPRHSLRDLATILEAARADRLGSFQIDRHLIGLDLGDGQPPIYGMFFGSAGIVKAILHCRRHFYPLWFLPDWVAHLMAALSLVASAMIAPHRPGSLAHSWSMHIHLRNRGILDGHYFLMMASTLDRLILGIRKHDDGQKGAIWFSCVEQRRGTVLRSIWAILTKRYHRAAIDGLHLRYADVIKIETRNQVTLDGELYQPRPGQMLVLDGSQRLAFLRLPS